MKKVILIILCLLSISAKPRDSISIECHNADMRFCINMTKEEVGKRFPSCHIYMVHKDLGSAEWTTLPDKKDDKELVQDLANRLNKKYEKPVVLFICNHYGDKISGKGVWYYPRLVWTVPDDKVPYHSRNMRGIPTVMTHETDTDEGCGSSSELIEGFSEN